MTEVSPEPLASIRMPNSVEWIVAALEMLWSPVLSLSIVSTKTPYRFIGLEAVPMFTPLPRVTVVESAALPN